MWHWLEVILELLLSGAWPDSSGGRTGEEDPEKVARQQLFWKIFYIVGILAGLVVLIWLLVKT